VMIDGGHTSEYQAAGFAAQGFAGINVDIAGPWSAFLEYKATWSDLTLDLENGATLDLEPWTHQFILGASFRW
ncbi:MAG: lipid A oxidase, partial [Planctomycetota bacterium]